MEQLLQHLRPTELIMLGVIIGLWLSARSRREQGRRIGSVEKKVAEVLAARVASGKRE
jgi:hypothetical protein